MNAGVPIIAPVRVSAVASSSTSLATPKSTMVRCSPCGVSLTNRLLGLMSRCTTPRAVRRGEPRADLPDQTDGEIDRQRAALGEERFEVPPHDEIHHQVGDRIIRDGGPILLEHGHHVRASDRSRGPRLTKEPLDDGSASAGRVGDDLHRDVAAQPPMVGAPHLAHGSRTESRLEPQILGQRGPHRQRHRVRP